MTNIVVVATVGPQNLPQGVTFGGISIAVTDNSGAVLPAVSVNGTETPPFSASFTGATGPNEASAVLTALDSSGNPLGSPVTITETGTGGVVPGTFPAPTGGSISVS